MFCQEQTSVEGPSMKISILWVYCWVTYIMGIPVEVGMNIRMSYKMVCV